MRTMGLPQSPPASPHRVFRAAASAERPVMATEAWVGATFTSLLSLMVGIPALLAAITGPFLDEIDFPLWCISMVAAALWLWFDVPYLYRTWSCVRHRHRPLAPAVAARQPAVTWLLRPLAASWFLGHFLMAVYFAHETAALSAPGLDEARPTGYVLFVNAMALAYMFASNGFLLAGVKSLTGSDVWVRRAWNWRILVDLGLVGVVSGIARGF
jgi:hypothetical protein